MVVVVVELVVVIVREMLGVEQMVVVWLEVVVVIGAALKAMLEM